MAVIYRHIYEWQTALRHTKRNKPLQSNEFEQTARDTGQRNCVVGYRNCIRLVFLRIN